MAKGQLKKRPISSFMNLWKKRQNGSQCRYVTTGDEVLKFSLAFFLYLVIRQFIIYSTEYCSLVDVLVLLTLQLIFVYLYHLFGLHNQLLTFIRNNRRALRFKKSDLKSVTFNNKRDCISAMTNILASFHMRGWSSLCSRIPLLTSKIVSFFERVL